jgi:hypothetical protein
VVSALNLSLLALAAAGAALGIWAICWARISRRPRRAAWGRRLFVLTLLGLGAGGLVAAGCHADALAPLGLCAGMLVVGMVWEAPPERRPVAPELLRDFFPNSS